MPKVKVEAPKIVGISTCVPSLRFDNLKDTLAFTETEVRKVVAMAGVGARRVVPPATCSTDLCHAAATQLLRSADCRPDTIDALILITQTPDYFMPSSSCLLHDRLGLSKDCAAFDINLGCSGYIYGLWLSATILSSHGCRKVLLLHGDTPTLYADRADRSVSLLFGDAGSATLLETSGSTPPSSWYFILNTDGAGFADLIIEAGGFRDRFSSDRRKHYVAMNGANVFTFTITVLPPLIRDTLALSLSSAEEIDYYIFHQSNQFIMNHVIKKTGLQPEKVPIILRDFGNTGGPSVPLAITQGNLIRPDERPLKLMLLGYGVGLSWGSALVQLDTAAVLSHVELPAPAGGNA
jgi:3-oxoacyl-[acyl-carrier-protein] synthase-3